MVVRARSSSNLDSNRLWKLPLDGIDDVRQDLVVLHLPPPIGDDNPIIVLRFKEDSGRVTTARVQ